MDTDFNALASRVAATGEVRACLFLSRDGFILGTFPPNGHDEIRPAWLRVSTLGDPEKGFIEFPTESWAFVTRGSYAAFAVAAPGARVGVILDHLEQALLVAEQARSRGDAVRAPESIDLARAGNAPHAPPQPRPAPPAPGPVPAPVAAPVGGPPPGQGAPPSSQPQPPPEAPAPAPVADAGEVDRISLALEFSQLLQESDGRDE